MSSTELVLRDLHDAGVLVKQPTGRGAWHVAEMPSDDQLAKFLEQRGWTPQFETWTFNVEGENGFWFCDHRCQVMVGIYRFPNQPMELCIT